MTELFEMKGPPGQVMVAFPNVSLHLRTGYSFLSNTDRMEYERRVAGIRGTSSGPRPEVEYGTLNTAPLDSEELED